MIQINIKIILRIILNFAFIKTLLVFFIVLVIIFNNFSVKR